MAAVSLGSHLVHAAAATPNANLVSPGLAGFLVVVALGLVLWALLRSMSRHMAKVHAAAEENGEDPDGSGGTDEGGPDADGGDGSPAASAKRARDRVRSA
jgi:hypothetical protein